MPVEVKICGLNAPAAVDAAIEGGARLAGFVFYPPSPRDLGAAEAAPLIARVPAGVIRVGLFVDAGDDDFDAVLAKTELDLLQLHGAETPERVAAIKARTGLPVMKVIKIADKADLAAAAAFDGIADRLLFDAKPAGATVGAMDDSLPGGNARAFDWPLMKAAGIRASWMLAGGLTAENIARAVAASGATALDVSSGVEDAPGVKNPEKIKQFLAAAAVIQVP